jgi:hypothetical protein
MRLDNFVIGSSRAHQPSLCFIAAFSNQKSGIQGHSRVQWRDEFVGTNYQIEQMTLAECAIGRFASFVHFGIEQLRD